MGTVPQVLKWAVTALIVVLVVVAAAGSGGDASQHWGDLYWSAGLGALFLIIYFAGIAFAAHSHETQATARFVRKDHRIAVVWLLALVGVWAGLLFVSSRALWLAFPLIILQIGVLGTAWGTLAALLTAVTTAGVSVLRLPEGASPVGPLLGPLLGGAVAGTFMWGILTIARESRARKEALEELQNARTLLVRAEQDALVMKERQRLAGELHDTVSQGLSATAMLLRAAQTTPDSGNEKRLLREALAATEANLLDARRITAALAPKELSDTRLPNALRKLAAETSTETYPEVSVEVSESSFDLPLAEEAALLRVAQSALWNLREHSGAAKASIRLSRTASDVLLEIEDNGCGFPPGDHGAVPGRGVGIPTMTRRMESVGGSLAVESNGGGTYVRAVLPLNKAK